MLVFTVESLRQIFQQPLGWGGPEGGGGPGEQSLSGFSGVGGAQSCSPESRHLHCWAGRVLRSLGTSPSSRGLWTPYGSQGPWECTGDGDGKRRWQGLKKERKETSGPLVTRCSQDGRSVWRGRLPSRALPSLEQQTTAESAGSSRDLRKSKVLTPRLEKQGDRVWTLVKRSKSQIT